MYFAFRVFVDIPHTNLLSTVKQLENLRVKNSIFYFLNVINNFDVIVLLIVVMKLRTLSGQLATNGCSYTFLSIHTYIFKGMER